MNGMDSSWNTKVCRGMVLDTVLRRLPLSDSAKVLIGTSLIIGASAYWTFNKGGKGYDSMADKLAIQKRKAELKNSEQAQ